MDRERRGSYMFKNTFSINLEVFHLSEVTTRAPPIFGPASVSTGEKTEHCSRCGQPLKHRKK